MPNLILSRKLHQSIHIGDDVQITVVEIRDGKVRIAIEAPAEVPVFRTEIYRDILASGQKVTPGGNLRPAADGRVVTRGPSAGQPGRASYRGASGRAEYDRAAGDCGPCGRRDERGPWGYDRAMGGEGGGE